MVDYYYRNTVVPKGLTNKGLRNMKLNKAKIGIIARPFYAVVGIINNPFKRSLETSIVINESPDKVWEKIIAFGNYKQWSPFIKSIEGELKAGQSLKIFIQPEGQDGMVFTPTVLNVDEEKELRWLGKLGVRGIFDAEHYFKLEKLKGNQTKVVHGENFTGLLAAAIWLLIEKSITQGFISQNKAIKEAVEL